MPIRPENASRYPKNWLTLSLKIKDRADWRCECEGECGRGTHQGRCPNVHGGAAYGTGSKVVLTTAHLGRAAELPMFLAVTGAAKTNQITQFVGFGMAFYPEGYKWLDMMHRRALSEFFGASPASCTRFTVTFPGGLSSRSPGGAIATSALPVTPQPIRLTDWRYLREPFEATDIAAELTALRDVVAALSVTNTAANAFEFGKPPLRSTDKRVPAHRRARFDSVRGLLRGNGERDGTHQTFLFSFAAAGRSADARPSNADSDLAGQQQGAILGACLPPRRCGERERSTAERAVASRWAQAWSGHEAIISDTSEYPENCDPENLKAMCQGCHLHYDREHHAETAYRTRREGKAVDMFEHPPEPAKLA